MGDLHSKAIESTSFVVDIQEYGKLVRTYSDSNLDRFKEVSESIILSHLKKNCNQNSGKEHKNITINIYTY